VTVKASVGFFNFFNNRRFYALKKKGFRIKERKKERKREKEKEGMAWNGMEERV
jgi:hypothetical protein